MKKARWALPDRKARRVNKESTDFQDRKASLDRKVPKVPWVRPAHTDRKAIEVSWVFPDFLAMMAPTVIRVSPDHRVRLDGMDAMERMVRRAFLDDLVLRVCLVFLVPRAYRAPRVNPQSDTLALPERRVSLACPACRAFPDLLDETDFLAKKAIEATSDLQDREDRRANRECRATPVSDRSDRKETRAI